MLKVEKTFTELTHYAAKLTRGTWTILGIYKSDDNSLYYDDDLYMIEFIIIGVNILWFELQVLKYYPGVLIGIIGPTKFFTSNTQHQVLFSLIIKYTNFYMKIHEYFLFMLWQKKKTKEKIRHIRENQSKSQMYTHKILESLFLIEAINPSVDLVWFRKDIINTSMYGSVAASHLLEQNR